MVKAHYLDTVYLLGRCFQLLRKLCGLFVCNGLKLLTGIGILRHQLLNCALEVRDIVHEVLKALQEVFHVVDGFLGLAAGYCLDPADTSRNGAFGNNLEQADSTC